MKSWLERSHPMLCELTEHSLTFGSCWIKKGALLTLKRRSSPLSFQEAQLPGFLTFFLFLESSRFVFDKGSVT